MTFNLQYETNTTTVVSAVINDSRSVILALKGQSSAVVYAYTQNLLSQIVPGVLVYRIVGDGGVLAGIVALSIQNGVASVLFSQMRPAFIPFLPQISIIIANFITSGAALQDTLY